MKKLSLRKRISVLIIVIFILSVTILSFMYYAVPKRYSDKIETTSSEFGVDPDLVYAVIRAESNFNQDTVSTAGAVGIMQIMPDTAEFICKILNENLNEQNLDDNIRMGVYYLSYLKRRFEKIPLITAAYNAGEGIVSDWSKKYETDSAGNLKYIPYTETQRYVKKVKFFYKCYKILY